MMSINHKKFRQVVYTSAARAQRAFPWRNKTTTPYHILISEIMLQQTQVSRVVPKYRAFIKKFPSVKALAEASFSEILRAWQGLGYNRRAKYLHTASRIIVSSHQNRIPKDIEVLQTLPGIGAYTAGAIVAFAYNQPVIFIETNIRSVFIHHFFAHRHGNISDKEILPLIAKTLDAKKARIWYWALMDYGALLKAQYGNPNKKSAQYARQSKFEGSHRQIRGKILKLLLEQPNTQHVLIKTIGIKERKQIINAIAELSKEKIIIQKNNQWSILTEDLESSVTLNYETL